ncbi:hypothetical protein D3C73_608080 [compost metagenome]
MLGDGQRHTGAVVTNADGHGFRVPVQGHLEVFRAGVGGVVEQIQQRLSQIRRRRHARHSALAEAVEAITGLRTHQMPAVQRFVEPVSDVLHLDSQTPVGFGGPHQLLQGLLAEFDLILQHLQIVLQHRVGMVLLHFLEQHAHGRQRRAQFMGSASGLGGDGEQLLIAQTFFTTDRP